MIGMSTIRSIREKKRNGDTIASIARTEGISEPTVRKYLAQEDFSPKLPHKKKSKSKLDPYKPQIDEWLSQDKKMWHKQRHTAKRVFDCLVEEYDFQGSYTLVQAYVRECKQQGEHPKDSYLDLDWPPGEAQVDFGEADFKDRDVLTRMNFLAVSFPFSTQPSSKVGHAHSLASCCDSVQ